MCHALDVIGQVAASADELHMALVPSPHPEP